ncbi:MAG TPA: hypothetical protein VHQ99_00585 [Gaiellaceae bacterium]|jgi:hypothetical protein|nr:hypothetical protein [Gaiellaceae bacterium]
MESPTGALLITVVLLLLFLFCLEMPGDLKLLGLPALAVNARWWWFVARADMPDDPWQTK